MSTEVRTFNGFVVNSNGIMNKRITVRFTSDIHGETISLDDGVNMLSLPFEKVEKLIMKARKNK